MWSCKKKKDEIKIFFEVIKSHNGKSFTNLSKIQNFKDLLCLTNGQKYDFCKIVLEEKELFNALKFMSNKKTPENDGSSKGFYEAFWNELKDLL